MSNLLQQVLTSLLEQHDTSNDNQDNDTGSSSDSSPSSSNSTALTTTNGAQKPLPKSKQRPIPTTLPGLVKLLFSFSALRDWLKLIVIGGFFESCRRLASYLYRKIVDSFFLTVTFTEDDDSFDWMMVWLSKRPAWGFARELQVTTRSWGLGSSAVRVPGDEDEPSELVSGSSKKLGYLPSMATSYTLWHKGHWMQITRTEKQKNYYSNEEYLTMRILTRSHRFLNEILLEAKREYLAQQEHYISIYVSDSNNSWRHVASRPKRPLKSIILDPGIKDLLVEDARDFLESKSWYAARGIPFRRGYLLYGAPGSGKTSLIHSMAGELGLDVYIVSLSRAGLDDTALSELISELPEKCIALMEDIDAAFHQTLNRDASNDSEDGAPPPPGAGPPTSGASTSRISLSGLLNALDGVGAQEGRILYATTNKYHALDPALCRPGRMDIHVEFKLASKYQAGELFRGFYLPVEEEDEEKEAEKEKEKSDESDSGYNTAGSPSPASRSGTSTPVPGEASSSEPSPPTSRTVPESEKPTYWGASHRLRAPKLNRKQVDELVEQFREVIPEREVSMASLQGYLMTYKTRPYDAVKNVVDWLEKEREEKKKRDAAAKKKEEAEKKKREEEAKKKEEEEKKKAEEEAKKKEEEEKKKKEEEDKKAKEAAAAGAASSATSGSASTSTPAAPASS
ncbi:hypothetical protein AX16_008125 [Volvariella volvacea WC 439]|nr:hypothetical protein AX16_008125 [Volvariella volvacea WC 439]